MKKVYEDHIVIKKQDLIDLLHIYKRVLLKCKRNLMRGRLDVIDVDLGKLYELSCSTDKRIKVQVGIFYDETK